MALIFAPLVKVSNGKLPLSVGVGAFTPNTTFLGLNITEEGRIFSVLDGAIAYYSHGLPFDTDGRLVVSQNVPLRHDMSVPFTANGAISGGS